MKDEKHNELLTRGVDEIIGEDVLREQLKNKEILTIKLGVDPTSPNLHLGRSVPLLKLRDFQELGHKIVFIVGDFTGVIGDTSDKESERPMLSRDIIEENKKSYFAQVGKIIDLSKTELRYNSEWLGKLTYSEIGEHADQFSVAEFIARENIKKRMDAGKRVSLREVLYPLMQGYDSVVINASVEIGGVDQRFNLLAGRSLQSHYNQKPQSILTNPLIPGLDGRKMSSSWGNTINLNDEAEDMYGKVMSLNDELVVTYFELCTRIPLSEVEEIKQNLLKGELHPRDAKMKLARDIVTLYHSEKDAKEAEDIFVKTFQKKEVPEDIRVIKSTKGCKVGDVFVENSIVPSKSEWRRLVEGGGVHTISENSKTTISDVGEECTEDTVFKIGKRTFVKIVVG
jgi:tyrosyl-tRNA synthetase